MNDSRREHDEFEYQTEPQMFRQQVASGIDCPGDDCRVWILSPWDTWERCPNHAGEDHPHPEDHGDY